MDRNELLHYLTTKLMHAAGFDDTTQKTSPIEWDPDIDDSQYAMRLQDVEAVLGALEELDDVSYDLTPQATPTAMTGGLGNYIFTANSGGGSYNSYIYTPQPAWPNAWPPATPTENVAADPDPNVCTHVEITHRLADNSTLDEVHEWLEKAKCLELPGDTKITGSLHVSVSIRDAFVERYTEEGGLNPVRAYGVVPQPESDST
jgi:hypothetical protein